MNVRKVKHLQKPRRDGFTLIELLVVISIIAVLASLILPGVQNAREAARRTTCLNNMKNIGLAVVNYTTANGGKFPALVGDNYYYTGTNATGTPIPAPWTLQLLPYLDEAAVFERLTGGQPWAAGETLDSLTRSTINVYKCPSDVSSTDAGAFSFAASAGYMDVEAFGEGSTSQLLGRAGAPEPRRYLFQKNDVEVVTGLSLDESARRIASTGVFWRQNPPAIKDNNGVIISPIFNPTSIRSTMDTIRDGTSQTIMLSENLSNGGWIGTNDTSVNLGSDTANVGFGIQIDTADLSAISQGVGIVPISKINSELTRTGSIPRASSAHPQVVNTVFCDGSVRNLSQNIDMGVYARLISSNGNSYNQSVLSGDSY